MFATLIESAPRRKPDRGGGMVSALLHSALIAGAVYATTSGQASRVAASAASQAQKIQWLQPAAEPQSAPAPKPKPKAPAVAPTKVPTETPPVNPNAQAVELDAGGVTDLAGGGASGAFNSFEVDVEVVGIMGTIRPQYPPTLKSSGTEGRVVAEFVVNERGRVARKTFRVISSTHLLFSDAVSRALPQMRFKPARMGARPVPQLVQQLFVFRLEK